MAYPNIYAHTRGSNLAALCQAVVIPAYQLLYRLNPTARAGFATRLLKKTGMSAKTLVIKRSIRSLAQKVKHYFNELSGYPHANRYPY